MELEEIKNLWQKYDHALNESRRVNEKLLQELVHTKSGGPLKKMLNAEYFGAVACLLLLVIFAAMGVKATASSVTIVSYSLIVLAIIGSIVACVYKIRVLSGIDFSGNALTDVAYKMQRFRLFISRERVLGVIFLPLLICCTYMFLDNVSVEDLSQHWFRIVAGSVVGMAIALIVYKSMYFDNIDRIQKNIDEIKAFREDAA